MAENQEGSHHHHHRCSDTKLVGGDGMSFSHPLRERGGGENSTVHIRLPDENTSIATNEVQVDIKTADVRVDSTAVESGEIARGSAVESQKWKSSLGSSEVRKASSTSIKKVSRAIMGLASLKPRLQRSQPARRFNDQTQTTVVHALKGLEFVSKTDRGATWTEVERRFHELTSKTNGLLPRADFGQCIGMHKENDKEFSRKLFNALARGANISGDSITKAQLKEFWDKITDESFKCRLEIFFNMIDDNADGKITENEVKEIISSSASSNKLSNIKNQADEYARLIMEGLDPNNLGYIMVEDMKTLLLQDSDEPVRVGSAQGHRDLKKSYRDFWYLLIDNWQRVWVMALWIGVMAGLFAYKYVQYRNRAVFDVMGHCVCMAKGAAETLKLNMALILLPMCRNTITWLRNKTVLAEAVPFDDNIDFHKVIAVAIAIAVGIHGLSHLTCDFPHLLNASPEKYEPMEPFFGDQPASYWHLVRGWEGVTGIVMVVVMVIAFTLASPWLRRNKVNLPKPLNKLAGFNAFWYSHHLFIVVYILLIIHGIKLYLTHEWYKKTTWMYLAIPIILYAGERLIRAFRSRIKAVKILKVPLCTKKVLALHMSKPQGFQYKSGQYIFVKCAAVSPFEWHPFSITSSPGDDYLSVHIQTAGDWTGQLNAVFSKICQPPSTVSSGSLRADLPGGENKPNFPRVVIDGPYGAPTQDYNDYEVVLLIGLGIGATPMISVLKDIINNLRATEGNGYLLEEGGGGGGGVNGRPSPPSLTPMRLANGGDEFKIRRVYFYWVTREQGSFECFKSVMNEVAEMDRKRVIEMHVHCTSVYEKGDARSALITMLQDMKHAENGVDIVSGTRVMSHFAKPNWEDVYERIANEHPNSTVGVFYCGTPALVKDLKHLASDFSHETHTKFEFHKENF